MTSEPSSPAPCALCPFCGSADTHVSPGVSLSLTGISRSFFVSCLTCDAHGGVRHKTEEAARREWREVSDRHFATTPEDGGTS